MTEYATKCAYERLIRGIAPDLNPRHVEAFLRVNNPTLDHLNLDDFRAEIKVARTAIAEVGDAAAEQLALSMGV